MKFINDNNFTTDKYGNAIRVKTSNNKSTISSSNSTTSKNEVTVTSNNTINLPQAQ